MLEVFENNKQLNEVVNSYYILAGDEDIDVIDSFFQDSKINIKDEFNRVEEITNKINNKKTIKLIKMYAQNILYSLIGMRQEAFYKTINNSMEIKKLEEERDEYYTKYLQVEDELKNVLVYLFSDYYDIIQKYGNKKDLREMYAIYQTIAYYLMQLLPEGYKSEMFKLEEMQALLEVDEEIDNKSFIYIRYVDKYIREYILKRYNYDIYESKVNEKRQRKL